MAWRSSWHSSGLKEPIACQVMESTAWLSADPPEANMSLAFILGIGGGAFALIAGHPLGVGLGVAVLWSGLRVLRRGLDG